MDSRPNCSADSGRTQVSGAYPFSDSVLVSVSKAASLSLRVPCWSEGALVQSQGLATQSAPFRPCAFANVSAAAGEALNVAPRVAERRVS